MRAAPVARIRHGSRATPAVALTFDDGPGPDTDELLEALARAEAPATFFLVGERVARAHPLVARIAAAGHEIGSHTWSHGRLADRPWRAWIELVRTAAAIRGATGTRPRLFRPPYAQSSPRLALAARLAGSRVVTWDVDPRDWQAGDAETVTERVLRDAWPGSIVLLHEGRGSISIDAVAGIVAGLRERGLEPVTVSALLAR